MTPDDSEDRVENDDVLAVLLRLKIYDISPRRARQLSRRCHAVLQPQSRPHTLASLHRGLAFRQIIAPALGGAWCLAYLVEIVRRAALYFSTWLPRGLS
jgi:hypothetical protein